MTRRELRSEADEQVVGAVDSGKPEPFEGAAASVLASMRRALGDAETVRRVIEHGWSNGYLYFAPAESDRGTAVKLRRKHDPLQPRDDEGKWTDGLPGAAVVDKLKLAGKIELAPDQRLVSSSKVSSDSGHSAVFAAIEGLAGPELRVGIVAAGDERQWRAGNKGSTVKLDGEGTWALRNNTHDMARKVADIDADYKATVKAMMKAGLWDNPPADLTDDQKALVAHADMMTEGDTRHEGVLASGPWGDLVYDVITDDDVDNPITVRVEVRPPNAGPDWRIGDRLAELSYDGKSVGKFVAAVEAAATLPGSRVAVRPEVRAIVRQLLRGVLRKYDPTQPRDKEGQWSKSPGQKILDALKDVPGQAELSGPTSSLSFPDRDGQPKGRAIEFEPSGDGHEWAMYVTTSEMDLADNEDPPTITFPSRPALDRFAKELAATQLAADLPPLDPTDRRSVLLHAALGRGSSGAGFTNEDDESYVDVSSNADGAFSLEAAGPDGDVIQFELDAAEMAAFHASIAARSIWDADVPSRSARATLRRLLREFSEAKVKRDRKGRFAKRASAAETLAEMDDLMARLDALMKSSGTDDDEVSDLDMAMDFMKTARRSRERRGDEDDAGNDGESEFETGQYNSFSVSADPRDGTVGIEHDEGSFWMPAKDAEEIAEALDEFEDVPVPSSTDAAASAKVLASKTTSSGKFTAVLYDSGIIEFGDAATTPSMDDEPEENVIIDPGNPEDARRTADALEEAAEVALKGAAK